MGNYQELFSRIQSICHLIGLPNLEELEIELTELPTFIRTYNGKKILEKVENIWKEFLFELRMESNLNIRDAWKLNELNKQQWVGLCEIEKYVGERAKYSEYLGLPKVRNYQNCILNRERFIKRLDHEISLELEKTTWEETFQIYEEKPITEEVRQKQVDIDPLEEWLCNLGSNDRMFVDDLFLRFNSGKKVALYETGIKKGIPRQKIEYIHSIINTHFPKIQKVESYKKTEYSLITNDESWLLFHGDRITSIILRYMYNNQKYRLSENDIGRIYKISNKNWIQSKISKLSKHHPKLDRYIEEDTIEIFQLTKPKIKYREKEQEEESLQEKGNKCVFCSFSRHFSTYKGNRYRGDKWFCFAFDCQSPKEIRDPNIFPKWCPKDQSDLCSIPLCFTCIHSKIKVKVKQSYQIEFTCNKQKSDILIDSMAECFEYRGCNK